MSDLYRNKTMRTNESVRSTYGVCNMKSISSCGHEYDFRRIHLNRFISNIPVPKKAAVAVDGVSFFFNFDIE